MFRLRRLIHKITNTWNAVLDIARYIAGAHHVVHYGHYTYNVITDTCEFGLIPNEFCSSIETSN